MFTNVKGGKYQPQKLHLKGEYVIIDPCYIWVACITRLRLGTKSTKCGNGTNTPVTVAMTG